MTTKYPLLKKFTEAECSEHSKSILLKKTGKGQIRRKYLQTTHLINDISKYIKLSKFSIKKINNPVKAWQKILNKHIRYIYIYKTNKHMEMYFTTVIIRKMEIKTILIG